MNPDLTQVPGALIQVLSSPRAAEGLHALDAAGLLDELLPELAPARGVEQPSNHHYYDVFNHSIEAVARLDLLLDDAAPADEGLKEIRDAFREAFAWFLLDTYLTETVGGQTRLTLLKLAGLLHDISKPETKTVEPDGRVRFLGHSEQGAQKAESICERLGFDQDASQFVAILVEEHLRPTQISNRPATPSRRALDRFFRDLDDAAPACLILSLADAAAAQGPRLKLERWRRHVAYISWVLAQGVLDAEPVEQKRRLITGDELMAALVLEPGAVIGRLIRAVDEAEASGAIKTREEALGLAKAMLAELGSSTRPSKASGRADKREA